MRPMARTGFNHGYYSGFECQIVATVLSQSGSIGSETDVQAWGVDRQTTRVTGYGVVFERSSALTPMR